MTKKPTTRRAAARARKPQADVTELAKRIDALERRIAILEAKMPPPKLGEILPESVRLGAKVGLSQDQ